MGKRMLAGLARAESGEGSGKWEVGRVDRKEVGWGGVDGNGEGETGRGRQGGGNLEGGNGEGSNRDGKRVAMGRGRGAMGKGRWGGGKGEGKRNWQEDRGFHRWI